jgi:hypothetical protein
MENAMLKYLVLLLVVAAVSLTLVGQTGATSDESQAKSNMKASAKEARWQGHITRLNKDQSSITVRGGKTNKDNIERDIFYDSSTQWTKQSQPADQNEFKEDSFVIVLGHYDDKGALHASRIDLRRPR